MTLPEHAHDFLSSVQVERGLSPNTAAAYRLDLTQYQSFLDQRMEDPTEDTIRSYLEALRGIELAHASVARKLASIRAYHRFLVIEGLSEDDPTVRISSPKRPSALPKALETDEVASVLDGVDTATAVGRRDLAILEVLYATGCRATELSTLGLHDYDRETRTALVTGKGNKQRIVPLGSFAVRAIDDWLADRLTFRVHGQDPGSLFLSTRGNPMSRQAIWRVVKAHGAAAGIAQDRLSPHVFRHSAATHMVEGGADLRTVQEILGHASLSTTQIYTKVSPEHLREVVATSHPRS